MRRDLLNRGQIYLEDLGRLFFKAFGNPDLEKRLVADVALLFCHSL